MPVPISRGSTHMCSSSRVGPLPLVAWKPTMRPPRTAHHVGWRRTNAAVTVRSSAQRRIDAAG